MMTPLRVDLPRYKQCGYAYYEAEDEDHFGTGLCYSCFDDAVDLAEERRRERIARQNEY